MNSMCAQVFARQRGACRRSGPVMLAGPQEGGICVRVGSSEIRRRSTCKHPYIGQLAVQPCTGLSWQYDPGTPLKGETDGRHHGAVHPGSGMILRFCRREPVPAFGDDDRRGLGESG